MFELGDEVYFGVTVSTFDVNGVTEEHQFWKTEGDAVVRLPDLGNEFGSWVIVEDDLWLTVIEQSEIADETQLLKMDVKNIVEKSEI